MPLPCESAGWLVPDIFVDDEEDPPGIGHLHSGAWAPAAACRWLLSGRCRTATSCAPIMRRRRNASASRPTRSTSANWARPCSAGYQAMERSTLFLLDPSSVGDSDTQGFPQGVRTEIDERRTAPLSTLAFGLIALAFLGTRRATARQRRRHDAWFSPAFCCVPWASPQCLVADHLNGAIPSMCGRSTDRHSIRRSCDDPDRSDAASNSFPACGTASAETGAANIRVGPCAGRRIERRPFMMPGVLARYIAWRFAVTIALILASVGSVILLFSFVDVLRHFSHERGFNAILGLRLAAMHVPLLLDMTLPFAFLFGTVLSLLNLSRKLELVIARASGVSGGWGFLRAPFLVALICGTLATAVLNPVAIELEERVSQTEAELSGRSRRSRGTGSARREAAALRSSTPAPRAWIT